jgi:nucleotide-binding universal stress UspA family protein
MESFRKILFAADFSRNSHEAYRLARSLAAAPTSRITVLYVDEPTLVGDEPAHFGEASAPFPRAGENSGRADAIKTRLRQLYAADGAMAVDYRVQEGEPGAQILRSAVDVGANLIVMGTHGRRGLDRLMAGSVATEVLRGAECPVVALRALPGTAPPGEIRAILHPTDFSENSQEAQHVARSLARELGTRLIILHVAPVEPVVDRTAVTEVDPRTYRNALDEVRRRLAGPDLKHPVEIRLSRGSDREEILQVAGEVGCGLIVMGSHGRTGLSRLLLGSVAEAVMTRANCPVLIVKQRGEVPAVKADQPARKTVTIL